MLLLNSRGLNLLPSQSNPSLDTHRLSLGLRSRLSSRRNLARLYQRLLMSLVSVSLLSGASCFLTNCLSRTRCLSLRLPTRLLLSDSCGLLRSSSLVTRVSLRTGAAMAATA